MSLTLQDCINYFNSDEYKNNENYGYDTFTNKFGNIVVKVEYGNYEGDTAILYDNDEIIGLLNYGWGSCSGCDAYEGCYGSITALADLMFALYTSIKWLSKDEMLKFLKEHDWEGDYSYMICGHSEFVDKAIKYLEQGE